ncbi:hypothetical protein HPB51_019387 [Rhipicephalus microplus]|uniref:Uncharacterized protein n=1 Tax=Rhipicephalus microplus TaxID=6941 RepID=A0A9J6DC67_RHIMP|nr:hypothetical protein HPB51_019387 [Rhipicephalus microplus]
MQARRGGFHTASRAAPCISIAPGPAAAAGPNGSQTPWYRLGAPLSLEGAAPTSSSPGAAYRQRCEDRRRRARTAALRAACMQVRHVSAALLASASRLLSPPQAEPSSPDDDGQDHTRSSGLGQPLGPIPRGAVAGPTEPARSVPARRDPALASTRWDPAGSARLPHQPFGLPTRDSEANVEVIAKYFMLNHIS